MKLNGVSKFTVYVTVCLWAIHVARRCE